ncbi:hypothetical protein ACX80B_17485 [Arthrobacter monumenti]
MADKDNDSTSPPRGRKWIIGGAVVLVLALIAVVVGSNIPSSFIPSKDTEPSPASETATGIAAGAGGAEVGADGVTMIGYEPTCDGAVKAATNYLKALESVHVVSDEEYKALLDQIVLPGSYKEARLDQLTKVDPESVGDEASKRFLEDYKEVVHPKWGGAYKVKSCEPEAAAVVGVFPCTYTAPFVVEGQKAPASIDCQSRQVSLQWSDGDWKVADISTSDDPASRIIITDSGTIPQDPDKMPLSEQLRDRFLVNLNTDKPLKGWIDYANVNRN